MSLPVALGLVPRPRTNSASKNPSMDNKFGTPKKLGDKLAARHTIDKKKHRPQEVIDKNVELQQTIDKKPDEQKMSKPSGPQKMIDNKYGLTLSKMEMYYLQDSKKRSSRRK